MPDREWLRHTVATLAYRGGKVVRDAPPDFAGFRAKEGSRAAGQILAHIGDLLDWALSSRKAPRHGMMRRRSRGRLTSRDSSRLCTSSMPIWRRTRRSAVPPSALFQG